MNTIITTQEIKQQLKDNDNHFILSDDDNQLEFIFSEHLGKFGVIFNGAFMSTARTISSPLKKFNALKSKYNL